MGILEELLGAGERQRDYSDFVNRYEQGHASEGYSDQEVVRRYSDVAHEVPRDDYAKAATDALARLSPQERAEFVKMLQDRAQARGTQLPRQMAPDPNPRDLGEVLTDLHQTPGLLRDLLGGGRPSGPTAGAAGPDTDQGNILASPLAKAALAGIAAMVVKRVMRGSA